MCLLLSDKEIFRKSRERKRKQEKTMLEMEYVMSRCIVWAACLWLCLRLLYGSDLIHTIWTGKMDWSIGVLYVYLVSSSLVLMYQMMLNQRLIRDVMTSVFSFSCDLLVLMFFIVFFVVYQRMRGAESIPWDSSVIIAIALLFGSKWKRRLMEIRADRTLSRFAKSFSVHVLDKSLKIAGLSFSLFLLKEILMSVFVSFIVRRPVFLNFMIWQGISLVFKGIWFNFVLDFSMISLEYFLFHPINFTQSPWVQMIPKMGVRAIKGVSLSPKNTGESVSDRTIIPKTEKSLVDYLHGLMESCDNSSQKPFVTKQLSQTGKPLLRTVHDIYQHRMDKIVGRQTSESTGSSASSNSSRTAGGREPTVNPLEIIGVKQFVFIASTSPSVSSLLSSSLLATFLAPIRGFLGCQACFDLHRITRSSKLRREPLFHANYSEWLSSTLNFFLAVTLQVGLVHRF